MTEDGATNEEILMLSEEAVRTFADLRSDAIIVCTMTTMKWLWEISPSPLNVSAVPMMGGASALGLGLALACPKRNVIVLDGDGSLLMELGSLATIAGASATNLIHAVFVNGVWFEGTADIAVPAARSIDFSAMAAAAGYPATYRIQDVAVLRSSIREVLSGHGPSMIHLDIERDQTARRWSAQNPQPEVPDSQFNRMGEELRDLRRSLNL